MYCRKCGSELGSTDTFCSNCGERQYSDNENITMEEPTKNIYDNTIQNNLQTEETKFDRFMKKAFFQNRELTKEVLQQAGQVGIVSVVLLQFVAFALLLLFDIEIPSLGITLLWWLFDCYVLKKQGIRGMWKMWGVIIIPVYLCIRAKKTNKKYTWAIVSIIVCFLGIGGAFASEFYGGTEVSNDSSVTKNDQSDMVQDENIDYICEVKFDTDNMACIDYTTVEDDGIKSITPNIYIPSAGEYSYEESCTPNKSSTKVTIEMDMANGITFTEKMGNVVSQGEYYMTGTSQDDVLMKNYTQNVLGEESQIVEMIRVNRSFERPDGSTISSPPYNYTVSVRAGTFEDCVCMVVETIDENGTNYSVCYYAPLVGKVLELHYDEYLNKEYGTEWYLYRELVGISTEKYNSGNVLANNNESDSSTDKDYNIGGKGQEYEYYDKGATHIVYITSTDYYSEITLQIDDGERISLPIWGIAENRYFSYSTDDELYYLERDCEKEEIYLRCEQYDGSCKLRAKN